MHIFAYVCNETSVAAQASENVFYRDFVKSAAHGAFVLFLDVEEYAATVYDGIYEVGAHSVLCSCHDGAGCCVAYALTGCCVSGDAAVGW